MKICPRVWGRLFRAAMTGAKFWSMGRGAAAQSAHSWIRRWYNIIYSYAQTVFHVFAEMYRVIILKVNLHIPDNWWRSVRSLSANSVTKVVRDQHLTPKSLYTLHIIFYVVNSSLMCRNVLIVSYILLPSIDLLVCCYVNEIYWSFSQPGRQPGRKIFSQFIWCLTRRPPGVAPTL